MSSRQVKSLRVAMNKAADTGNVTKTYQIFSDLISIGESPTTITYNILIKSHCRSGDPDTSRLILDQLISGQIQDVKPDNGTFAAVIGGLVQKKRMEEAWELLKYQHQLSFDTNRSFCTLLRGISKETLIDTVQSAVWYLGVEFNQDVLRTSIQTVLLKNTTESLDFALYLTEWSKETYDVTLDCKALTLLVNSLGGFGRREEALSLYDGYILTGHVPDLFLLSSILDILLSPDDCSAQAAEKILEYSIKTFSIGADVLLYNLMIRGFGYTKPAEPGRAIAYFERIIDSGFQATGHTFAALLNSFCCAGQPSVAEKYLREVMPQYGVPATSVHYNIILKGYSRCRCKITKGFCSCRICLCANPEKAMEIVQEMEKVKLELDAVSLITVVESFAAAGEVERASMIINSIMKLQKDPKLHPTIRCYNAVLRSVTLTLGQSANFTNCCHETDAQFAKKIAFSDHDAVLAHLNNIIRDINEWKLLPDSMFFSYTLYIYVCLDLFPDAMTLLKDFARQSDDPFLFMIKLLSLFESHETLLVRTQAILELMVSNLKAPVTSKHLSVTADLFLTSLNPAASATAVNTLISHFEIANVTSSVFANIIMAMWKQGCNKEAKDLLEKTEIQFRIKYLPHFKRIIV